MSAGRTLTIAGRSYPVLLPRLADPRLHVASVVMSVQVLGQVALGFDLSIAQILVSLGTAFVLEVGLRFHLDRVLAWPASGLLTANGVALILRVPGTEHGDWWSLRGWHLFVATTALGVVSKYVFRAAGRPLFNPSNVALVVCFLVVGSQRADPQDLWWGDMSAGLALTYLVVVVGGLLVTRRLGLLGMSVAFWVTFAAAMWLLVAQGHCMTARWNVGPVCGGHYWNTLALSPEILIFLFFMITDPRTTPPGRVARVVFGVAVAGVAAVLVGFQSTEFATKVALLASLVVVCAVQPLLARLLPEAASWRTRARPVAFGLASFTGLVAIALVGVGHGVTADAGAGSTIDRAALGLSGVEVPEVRLDDSVAEVSSWLDDAEAERIARDVAEDVELVRLAYERRDADLLEAAATGELLDALREGLTPDGTGAVGEPDLVAVDEVTIMLVRDPASFQSVPRVAVEVDGQAPSGAPVSVTLELATVGGHYLLAREVAPSG